MAEKILICDDDPDVREVLRCALEAGNEILEAANGDEALAIISKEKPRLILLDICMPGLSGLETLRAYCATHRDIITLVLTSQQDVDLARQALDLGARAYVTKPFEPGHIRKEVSRLISTEPRRTDEPWRLADDGPSPRV